MTTRSAGLRPKNYPMKCMGFILTMSWLTYGASPCSQPGVIFCNGFEGAQSEVQEAWGSSAAAQFAVADPGPFGVAGNKVLKLDNEIMMHVRRGLGAGYDRVYARWYQKFPAGYVWNLSHHHGFTYATSTESGASAYTPDGYTQPNWIQLEPHREQGNSVRWYAYHPGKTTQWGDAFETGVRIENDRWYCIETMIDLGTPTPSMDGANGVLDTWLDGVHYGPNTCGFAPVRCGGIWFRSCPSLKIRYVDIMSSAPGLQPLGTAIYYDDVVVSTQPIGPGTRVPYFQIPLVITNSQLTAGTVGAAYSTFLSATGGAKDYTWQLVSGSLPPGFSPLTVIGGLRGTPTQAGTFSFTVRVTDKSSPVQTKDKQLSITINPSTGIIAPSNPAVMAGVAAQVRSNRVLFQFPANSMYGSIRIMDALGHTVWEHGVKQGAVSAESPALSNGLYVGRIGNGSKAATFRFAVIR